MKLIAFAGALGHPSSLIFRFSAISNITVYQAYQLAHAFSHIY